MKIRFAIIVLLLVVFPAVFPGAQARAQRLTIGSGPAPDRIVLAKLLILMLQEKGVACADMTGLGSEDMAGSALVNEQLDIRPVFRQGTPAGSTEKSTTGGPEKEPVRLELAGLEDGPRIWLRQALARSAGLDTISSLAALCKDRPDRFELGLTPEFLVAENGYRPLAIAYGLNLLPENILQMDRVFLYPALLEKGVDLVIGRSLDWETWGRRLTHLQDDRGFFGVGKAAFEVRGDILSRHPLIGQLVAALGEQLTSTEMAGLVAQIRQGSTPGQAAESWLREKKLLDR